MTNTDSSGKLSYLKVIGSMPPPVLWEFLKMPIDVANAIDNINEAQASLGFALNALTPAPPPVKVRRVFFHKGNPGPLSLAMACKLGISQKLFLHAPSVMKWDEVTLEWIVREDKIRALMEGTADPDGEFPAYGVYADAMGGLMVDHEGFGQTINDLQYIESWGEVGRIIREYIRPETTLDPYRIPDNKQRDDEWRLRFTDVLKKHYSGLSFQAQGLHGAALDEMAADIVSIEPSVVHWPITVYLDPQDRHGRHNHVGDPFTDEELIAKLDDLTRVWPDVKVVYRLGDPHLPHALEVAHDYFA